MASKFYISVAERLKLKVRKFWWLIPTFVDVTGEELVGLDFLPPVLNRVSRKAAKMPSLSSRKIKIYEYLTDKEMLGTDQNRVIEHNFTYSLLRKALEKQTKK